MDLDHGDISLPNIGRKKQQSSDYKFGLKTPLKAKSHSGSGAILHDHSLQAGRMALTVSESVHITSDNRDRFSIASFIGGIYHDLGKAAAGFQEMLRNFKVNRWPPNKGGYRHEMLSAIIFLANSIHKQIWQDNKEILQAVYLSIIVHHKPYREKSKGRYPTPIKLSQWPGGGAFKSMYNELLLNKEGLQQCWNTIIEEITDDSWGRELIDMGWLSLKLDIPSSVNEAVSVFGQFQTEFALPGYDKGIITRTKYHSSLPSNTNKFISYVRAVVTVGDHLSSGNYLFLPAIPDLKRYDIFTEFSPRLFQSRCGQRGNLLLRAPTGSGKTEAAQHWIQNNQTTARGQLAKIFFVLPFQASINAMFSRLGNWVGYDQGLIGLQHSRAAQVLFSIIEDEIYEGNRDKVLHGGRKKVKKYHDPWSNFKKIKTVEPHRFSDLLLNDGYQRDYWNSPIKKQINTAAYSIHGLTRENFYPMKITTPHQLLGAVLQGRGWEVSIQEFEEACFVFDEVHVYDAHLTGLILGMAKLMIDEFNAKILFMSATFPTFLIELIQEHVSSGIPLIELDPEDSTDRDVLENPRHIIEVSSKSITSLLDDNAYLDELLTHENVLIICNTVRTAQNVYSKLQQYNKIDNDHVMLFHSRFKMEDRKKKEEQLLTIAENDIKFVVATQVVEVSLDIDLAFGIFEGAPLDALAQRLGRVNRKGNRDLLDTNIMITEPEGYWKYVYDEELTNMSIELLSSVEGKPLSEMELVDLIDELYQKQPWDEGQWSDFHRAFGNSKYQDFFNSSLPGTYSKWINDVIVDQSTNDVLHHSDIDEFKERKRKEPLRALDLLIPVRVYKDDYTYDPELGQKVLSEEWIYSPEIGLYKEK